MTRKEKKKEKRKEKEIRGERKGPTSCSLYFPSLKRFFFFSKEIKYLGLLKPFFSTHTATEFLRMNASQIKSSLHHRWFSSDFSPISDLLGQVETRCRPRQHKQQTNRMQIWITVKAVNSVFNQHTARSGRVVCFMYVELLRWDAADSPLAAATTVSMFQPRNESRRGFIKCISTNEIWAAEKNILVMTGEGLIESRCFVSGDESLPSHFMTRLYGNLPSFGPKM